MRSHVAQSGIHLSCSIGNKIQVTHRLVPVYSHQVVRLQEELQQTVGRPSEGDSQPTELPPSPDKVAQQIPSTELPGLNFSSVGLDRLLAASEEEQGRAGAHGKSLRRAPQRRALASQLSPRAWIVVLYVGALHLAYLMALHRGSAGCLDHHATSKELPY